MQSRCGFRSERRRERRHCRRDIVAGQVIPVGVRTARAAVAGVMMRSAASTVMLVVMSVARLGMSIRPTEHRFDDNGHALHGQNEQQHQNRDLSQPGQHAPSVEKSIRRRNCVEFEGTAAVQR